MKEKNLKIASENGINIPDFKVFEFDELLNDTASLAQLVKSSDYSGKNAVKETSVTLKQALAKRFISQYRGTEVNGGLFAVRSSCTAEDGRDLSFAGQFDTFINVPTDKLDEKLLLCLQSLYNENALIYALDNSIDICSMKMNVIVQQMVESELSGIMFTANPGGLLNEYVIVAGKGQGEGVVSGETETTTYYFNTTDKIYYFEGAETLLNKCQVEELVSVGERLKTIFGDDYLDIEYAFDKKSLRILQIRSITTLSEKATTILDNSNIVESYPGISLPLTASFVQTVYTGVFRGLAMRVLKNKKVISRYSNDLSDMVGCVNGRMYYKISNWYTIIKFLPLSGKIIPVWQEMLGIKNRSYDGKRVDIPALLRLKTYFCSVYELVRVPTNMKRLNEEFWKVSDEFYTEFAKKPDAHGLILLYENVRKRLLAVWDITLLNDMYSFIFTGLVKNSLKKRGDENAANECISGISGIESMKPLKALAALANSSKTMRGTAEFRAQCDEFIRLYGDRYLEELKLESKTFRTDEALLDEKIREYSSNPGRLEKLLAPDEPSGAAKSRRPLFAFSSRRAVLGIKNREISRLNRSRIYGIVREIVLALADIYVSEGLFDSTTDVFYLTLDELFALDDTPRDMRGIICSRKDEYAVFDKLPAYSRLIFSGEPFDKHHTTVNTVHLCLKTDTIRGVPCSNGIVTGEVLAVENVGEVTDSVGKILVTKMTDPGWVYLLAGAKGVIAQKGSLLSHTAIVSREIGIPSVVGVENALEVLKTGDIITMNGGTGKISFIERKTR